MKKININARDRVLKANIAVHSAISEEYNNDSHWRPENIAKVKGHIRRISEGIEFAERRVLDLGCGTGFIINLVKDDFYRVDGVDITEDMLKKVDTSNGNIFLKRAMAEDTGFDSDTFNLVTAYSFLDHLYDVESVLREAYRVLKPGGFFYADLNPNRDFWEFISGISEKESGEYSEIVKREIDQLANGDTLSNRYGLDKEVMEDSEPGKSRSKGFDLNEMALLARDIGFSRVEIIPDWFVGQADLIHNCEKSELEGVCRYLNKALPVSSVLFKYLRFEFRK